MPVDAYEFCPCGSGKKFKFCCMDIADQLEKAQRHRENNQSRMALQILDRIDKKHRDSPWVLIEKASILLQENEPDEARAVLDQLLSKNPDHKLGIALLALVSFSTSGFEASKGSIYRAFQQCTREVPDIMCELALSIASMMNEARIYLAARQFLSLALRLALEKNQQQIFLNLLKSDSNRQVPYPLRGVHQLARYSGDSDIEAKAAGAERLADIGCCEPAAELFTRLGEEEPDNAALWQNAGLCRAWGGDEASAADALHLAPRLHDDFETAVELETIAQLLDLSTTDDCIAFKTVTYQVESVSKLLGQVGEHDRIVRQLLPPQEDQPAEVQPDGLFQILDRPVPDESSGQTLTLDTIPNVDAEIIIFDADTEHDQPAQAFLTSMEGDRFDASRKIFEEAAGDNAKVSSSSDGAGDESASRTLPRQMLPLHWSWYVPPRTPAAVVENLEREKWQHAIAEGWSNQPLEALRGLSPLEAADNPDLAIPLTAAVYVLDSLCDRENYLLDVDEQCERLRQKPLQPIAVSEETPVNAFSSMQLNRLPVKQLNDAQLNLTLNRALLLHHPSFLFEVLSEALNRPACVEQMNLNRAYMTISDLCRTRSGRDEALQWIAKGFEYAGTQERAFEQQLTWKLRELSFRMEDPEDPELIPLLKSISSRYASKLPQLQSHLDELCAVSGIQPPWQDATAIIASATESGATADGGVWSPQSAGSGEATEGGEKKLWLPGQ